MDLGTLFSTFERSAFRLEALPGYAVEEERAALELFARSRELPVDLNADWVDILTTAHRAGRSMSRLRLLSVDLTEYEQFEVAAYERNIRAGEDIRTSARNDHPIERDFWFFDGHWLALMNYGPAGEWKGAEVVDISTESSPIDIEYWTRLFERSPKLETQPSK